MSSPLISYTRYEPQHEISNNVVCATSKGSDQPAHTSLCQSLEYSMTLRLLTEYNSEFIGLKGGCTGCTGSPESTLVKMQHCWKSHFAAHIIFYKVSH